MGHDDHRDVAGEHAALLDATLARDAERAAALLTEHLGRTARVLLRTTADEAEEPVSR